MADPATSPVPEDKRLERLFDYTRWHIGIYLSLGGGFLGLLGSRDGSDFLRRVIASPALMGVALGSLVIAGIAGGIVASAATRCRRFEELWSTRQKVYGVTTFDGETWAAIEHSAFWASLLFAALSVLSSRI